MDAMRGTSWISCKTYENSRVLANTLQKIVNIVQHNSNPLHTLKRSRARYGLLWTTLSITDWNQAQQLWARAARTGPWAPDLPAPRVPGSF